MVTIFGVEIDFLQDIGDILFRLVLALILGGVIGFEREFSGKAAGLRTNILICIGAATFTMVSVLFGKMAGDTDLSRVAAQIVTGIGFLGAGTIIQARGEVQGLTSAATIWVVAAIGLSVGAGYYSLALVATALVIVALIILGWIEKGVTWKEDIRIYEITLENTATALERVQEILKKSDSDLKIIDVIKEDQTARLSFRVTATAPHHESLAKAITPFALIRKIHHE